MHNRIRQAKYLVFLLLAGTCTGIFFYVRSFPFFRLYLTAGTEAGVVWSLAFLPKIAAYLGAANLILIGFWCGYALALSRISGKSFQQVLKLDAYTYLPLCLLVLSVFQGETFWIRGFVLLSQVAGNLLLSLTILIVLYLKIRHYESLMIVNNPVLDSGTDGGHSKSGLHHSDVKSSISWKQKLVVFLISLLVYLGVGFRVVNHLPLGGDEPHYLLIAHSLLHDRDLAVFNNYAQRDYAGFFPAELQPHLSLGKDGTRYPGHPIGLPILLVPAYAITSGRQGAVILMNLLAAFLALQIYLLAFSVTRNKRLALALWGVVSFTTPLLLYSSQIYPEVPSTLFLAIACRSIIYRKPEAGGLVYAFISGGSLAILPWLQQRMLLPAIILAGYHIIASVRKYLKRQEQNRDLLFEGIPLLLLAFSGLLMAGFYYHLYGNPMPNAPYISIGMKSIFSFDILVREGFLGLLLDQEAGLLMFSPYYVFLFAGFVMLLRKHRSRAFWLAGLILSIYIPCAGFTLVWRGAWSPASRYMVVLIPLLLPLVGEALNYTSRSAYRYVFAFLAGMSVGWSYVFLKTPSLSIMRSFDVNAFLERYVTVVVDPTQFFPGFTRPSPGMYLLAGMWVLLIIGFSWCVVRSVKIRQPGGSSPNSRIHPEQMIRTRVRYVFGGYGLLIGVLLIFSSLVKYTPSHAEPHVARNRYLRDFLKDFNRYAWFIEQIPIDDEELQFKYLAREKWGRVTATSIPRFIVSGPHEAFPRGKYTAYFQVMVADNSTDDVVMKLEVVTNLGTRVFSTKHLRGTDFETARHYQFIPLEFELDEDVTDLETRVIFYNRVDVAAKDVYIQPDSSQYYYRTGMAAFWDADYESAGTLLRHATSGKYALQARYQCGVIEQHLGNRTSSEELLQRVVAEMPDFADAHYRLGITLREQHKLAQAQHHLERATALLPSHLEAWKALHSLYEQRGMNAQAATAAQTIAALYEPQYPELVNLANQLLFLGYGMDDLSQGRLRIEYYWQALSPMDRNYVAFVHFKRSGRTKFQQDHLLQPTDLGTGEPTFYPTSQWRMGELIHERFEIEAPPGAYTVSLGVWDPEDTQERLRILSSAQKSPFGKNTIALQQIVIDKEKRSNTQ
jgi:tetratricopeptide (TPR) repeat protein